jgi:centrosomal protein CEP135
MCFRIQELQQEVHQLQEKLAIMESGVRDYSKQVEFLLLAYEGLR